MQVVLVGLVVIALALGFGATDQLSREVVLELRLPRVLLGLGAGAALSLAGLILQALFSNPLCEPYTLGVSSGAALASVMAGSLGFFVHHWGFSLPAFSGAIAFTLILDVTVSRTRSSPLTLLLSGVMLGFMGSSLVALWMAMMDSSGIQGALFWLLGDLSKARLSGALMILGVVVLIFYYLWQKRGTLDALLMGELMAKTLGVEIEKERRRLLLASSLLVAVAVSAAGMIGFIGLLVPHLARRLGGSRHASALPLSMGLGGILLVLADLLARVLLRPQELPVGVVTALAGAPLFLIVMLRRSSRRVA